MVIDSAFLGGVFRNFVDLIKWRTLMLMLFLGRELGRHTCGGRRPQASAIRPPSCTGLVLDTFFFRLRGKGRGTHLEDPTQHRSNSGAGARISSEYLTVKRDAGAASIRPQAGVPHPAAVVGGHYGFLPNFSLPFFTFPVTYSAFLEAYFFFFDFRISST